MRGSRERPVQRHPSARLAAKMKARWTAKGCRVSVLVSVFGFSVFGAGCLVFIFGETGNASDYEVLLRFSWATHTR